jgi:hypothetical protein
MPTGRHTGHCAPSIADQARTARVNRTAVNLAPLLKELRAAGVPSLNGIAAALNERRVPTPAGSGHCHAAQVAGVEAAAEVSCGTSVTRSPLTVGAGFPPLDRTPGVRLRRVGMWSPRRRGLAAGGDARNQSDRALITTLGAAHPYSITPHGAGSGRSANSRSEPPTVAVTRRNARAAASPIVPWDIQAPEPARALVQ